MNPFVSFGDYKIPPNGFVYTISHKSRKLSKVRTLPKKTKKRQLSVKKRLSKRRRRINKTKSKYYGGAEAKQILLKDKKVPILSCNPKVGSTIDNSCYNANILSTLVDAYNSSNPKDKMDNTNTKTDKEKLNELKVKMNTQCANHHNEELCIAKKLDPEVTKEAFMPEKEWKTPNEWLSNTDIDRVMAVYEKAYPKFKYCETLTIDFDKMCKRDGCLSKYFCKGQIKKNMLKNYSKWGIIFNLDNHTKGGSHWVSLFVDFDDHFAFYFDSAASTNATIPKSIQNLISQIQTQYYNNNKTKHKSLFGVTAQVRESVKTQSKHLKILYNKKAHQKSNTECGVYSLFFIITMLTKRVPYITDEMNSQTVQELFLTGTIPDNFIEQYRHVFFSTFAAPHEKPQ